jgi:hypothetical protein
MKVELSFDVSCHVSSSSNAMVHITAAADIGLAKAPNTPKKIAERWNYYSHLINRMD